ncbi:MAG: polymerase III subunit beta protein [Candidatus Yanofskybacteria bacterium GW2011_GWA2_41_22]|uniref:Beta sliding clamp n=4 Tax=Parcubacteria group TaxID=1794811 RepID=A0A0G0VKR1_9BACT|nr:MAG: polymerase III subunit beta protein [Candidatus Yanofskybacteria bacterium GW2011_GWA2_41_22]KKS25774.1 MAG: polymerase III subunit beta protein [Candidatus Jorgensenbacteria bacterium GW2011_GWF2_41_8]KKS27669.1 MAG: polymerase III subunit beta protein [Candidatus Yanofskybacteria bacterium GW2011_GWC2_41_9]OGN00068.1 MAG: DNA polymerase III subunit beta [Candidatus Yanofskybacteria bacterium RIFCSPHIGHO2_01_FULL_41_27]OGN08755.1 MAG: DNA polymerase III subunit beta [Candidatus Yanofsk
MKLLTNQKNLKRALNIVERVVSKNNSLPILNNILLKTENGRLKVSATNLEIGINCFIGSKIEEVGQIAVPARIFSDFIGNVTDEKVAITTKNNILSIDSDKYKTQILSFDAKDFPIIPKIKDNSFGSISAKTLRESLTAVFDSVALSETRPELAGVAVNFNKNNTVFASTDSFRLTEKIVDLKNNKEQSIILPRNTAAELIRISNDLDGDIRLYMNDNQIAFANDDIEIISRVIDGNYPDYKKVIPEKFISRVLVNKSDLEKNVKLTGIFSSNISDIKIKCMEDKIKLISKNSDKGEIEAETEGVLKNDPFEISLNYHYLLDGLKVINTDKVVVEFTGQNSPLVLRQGDGSKNIVYLIMPLRS